MGFESVQHYDKSENKNPQDFITSQSYTLTYVLSSCQKVMYSTYLITMSKMTDTLGQLNEFIT